MPGTNNNKNQNEPLDPRTLEQLNAYLDYELSEEERGQVRDLLRRSPAAENEIATLKATSNVLRELPAVPAPRSFAVRPAMLEQPSRTPRSFTLFGWRPTPTFALSLGSVAAACLLILVLSVQLISNGGNGASQVATTAYNSNTATSGPNDQTSNPRYYSAPNGNGGTSVAAPAPRTDAAAAATPTTAPVAMAVAPQSSPAGGSSGAAGAPPASDSTNSSSAESSPTSQPQSAFAPANTQTAPAANSGDATNSTISSANSSGGSAEANPTATSALHAPTAAKQAPTATPEPQMALNNGNNAPDNGGISASGPMPPNDTNKPGNYNPFQSRGMDYWLVIEIALAALVIVLGVGAIVAQRRNR